MKTALVVADGGPDVLVVGTLTGTETVVPPPPLGAGADDGGGVPVPLGCG